MGKGQQQKEQRKVIVIGVSLVTGLPKTLPCWREKRRRIEQKLLVLHTHTHTSKWEERIEKETGALFTKSRDFLCFQGELNNSSRSSSRREKKKLKKRGRLFRCWWTRASDQIGAHSSFYLTGPHIISVSRHKRLEIRHFFFCLVVLSEWEIRANNFSNKFFRA
jgi:hypothetical protein